MKTAMFGTRVITFATLEAFVKFLDERAKEIQALHSEYSERVGTLLRNSENKPDEAEWAKQLGAKLASSTSGRHAAREDKRREDKAKTKQRGKGSAQEDGWLPYRGIELYRGPPAKGKAEITFSAMEQMDATLRTLEDAKKVIAELGSSGIGNDMEYVAYFNEGVLQRVVIAPRHSSNSWSRFEYKAGFRTR